MPLDRRNITVASRIMLPAYGLFAMVTGLLYLTDPGGALNNAPALRYQDKVMPWEIWGGWLMLISVSMTVIWARYHHRMVFSFVLAIFSVTWVVIGGTWAAAAIADQASPMGPFFALFVATAACASIASLVNRDK